MNVTFSIQDPTRADTTYLYEAIVEAAHNAIAWRGVYSFASREAVNWLFDEPVISKLVSNGGQADLLVGLDAITNRQTLERLQELEQQYNHFNTRVFWNDVVPLFHPKLSDFTYPNGGRKLIIGSGNLTPGGLMHNIEAYTTISTKKAEEVDVSAFDEFLERHADAIRPIDDEALARADQNLISRVNKGQNAGRTRITFPPRSRRPTRLVPAGGNGGVATVDRVLIAQIPKAGGRWSQVHFNADVVRDYFRMMAFSSQRVFLSHVGADGGRSEVEVRPCVYSSSNKNHKIEFGAASSKAYPASPPVLVLRERHLRVFDYMLLVPESEGYADVIELMGSLPTVGRGMPRVITDMNTLEAAWATCPLLTPATVEDHLV